MATRGPAARWVPERQDVIWIDCNPQAGSEMRDIHPMVVLSPRAFNARTSLVIGLPMTTAPYNASNPFAVPAGPLTGRKSGQIGHVLCHQPKSFDWQLRKAKPHPMKRMADDILAASGLIDGINYVKRTALAGEARGIPDFTFILPDQHVMFMDVKFPIDSYLAYLQAGSDHERAQHLSAFLKAVSGHVKALAKRDYVANDDRQAVDNVLMFVPNESIVSFIHQHAPGLVDEAMQQHVVLCSPLNLFVFLGVVRQAFDSFRIAQTSRQMLALMGRFAKEWDNYTTQVDRVRKQLGTVVGSFDALATTRRRVLEKPLRELDELRREEHVEIEGGWATSLADDLEDMFELSMHNAFAGFDKLLHEVRVRTVPKRALASLRLGEEGAGLRVCGEEPQRGRVAHLARRDVAPPRRQDDDDPWHDL